MVSITLLIPEPSRGHHHQNLVYSIHWCFCILYHIYVVTIKTLHILNFHKWYHCVLSFATWFCFSFHLTFLKSIHVDTCHIHFITHSPFDIDFISFWHFTITNCFKINILIWILMRCARGSLVCGCMRRIALAQREASSTLYHQSVKWSLDCILSPEYESFYLLTFSVILGRVKILKNFPFLLV